MYDTIADSWEGLEEILKDHFKHVTVQDAFENLMTTERNWNSFLNELDQNLQHGKPKVTQCLKDISHDTQLTLLWTGGGYIVPPPSILCSGALNIYLRGPRFWYNSYFIVTM